MAGLPKRRVCEVANGEVVREWESTSAAARALGVPQRQLYTNCKFGWLTLGHRVKFADEVGNGWT